jgi:hypothetical protein
MRVRLLALVCLGYLAHPLAPAEGSPAVAYFQLSNRPALLQRIDLETGRRLDSLRLPPDLHLAFDSALTTSGSAVLFGTRNDELFVGIYGDGSRIVRRWRIGLIEGRGFIGYHDALPGETHFPVEMLVSKGGRFVLVVGLPRRVATLIDVVTGTRRAIRLPAEVVRGVSVWGGFVLATSVADGYRLRRFDVKGRWTGSAVVSTPSSWQYDRDFATLDLSASGGGREVLGVMSGATGPDVADRESRLFRFKSTRAELSPQPVVSLDDREAFLAVTNGSEMLLGFDQLYFGPLVGPLESVPLPAARLRPNEQEIRTILVGGLGAAVSESGRLAHFVLWSDIRETPSGDPFTRHEIATFTVSRPPRLLRRYYLGLHDGPRFGEPAVYGVWLG